MAARRGTAVLVRTGPKASDIAKSARYEVAIAKAQKDLADRQAAIAKVQKDLADRQAKLEATQAQYEAHVATTGASLTPEQKAAALGPKPAKADLGPAPVPIRGGTWADYKPRASYDPYQLLGDFGDRQLRAVLLRATPAHLSEAVGIVRERNPGTQPTNGRTTAGKIDYIMQHVAPGY
jgi:hypothetical protein